MKSISMILFILFSMNSFANVSGTWEGTGYRVVSMRNATRTAKCQIKVSLTQTDDVFNLESTRFKCDTFFDSYYNKRSFMLKDGELFSEGKVVGSIQNNIITFYVTYYDDLKDLYSVHFVFIAHDNKLNIAITESASGSYSAMDYIGGDLKRSGL